MTPAMILAALDGVISVIGLINKLIANAKRTSEWTKEEEAAVDAKYALIGSNPWDQDTGK